MELHRVRLTQRELQALAGLRRDVDMTRMSRVVVPGCHLDLPDSEPRPVACSARRSNREAFLKPPTLARAPRLGRDLYRVPRAADDFGFGRCTANDPSDAAGFHRLRGRRRLNTRGLRGSGVECSLNRDIEYIGRNGQTNGSMRP